MRLKSELPAALKYQAVVIESAAREAGLEFFDVVFERSHARGTGSRKAIDSHEARHPPRSVEAGDTPDAVVRACALPFPRFPPHRVRRGPP